MILGLLNVIHCNLRTGAGSGLTAIQNQFKTRVLADGGVVESLECVNNAIDTDLNWGYYLRVVSDGGVVESLECVTI